MSQRLHTHPSIYHPHCIMFFSQYFSFPCQYHSTIAPYSSIHLPPTLYNVFLPVLQFPLSVLFHHCSIFVNQSINHWCYINLTPLSVIKQHTHKTPQIPNRSLNINTLAVHLQFSPVIVWQRIPELVKRLTEGWMPEFGFRKRYLSLYHDHPIACSWTACLLYRGVFS